MDLTTINPAIPITEQAAIIADLAYVAAMAPSPWSVRLDFSATGRVADLQLKNRSRPTAAVSKITISLDSDTPPYLAADCLRALTGQPPRCGGEVPDAATIATVLEYTA